MSLLIKYSLFNLLLSYSFVYAQAVLTDQLYMEESEQLVEDVALSSEYLQGVSVPEFTTCEASETSSALGRRNIRTKINNLQARINITRVNAATDPSVSSLIAVGTRKLDQLQVVMRQVSLCSFQSDLRADMAAIGDKFSKNRNLLSRLEQISSCFDVNSGSTGVSKDSNFVKSTFDSIFDTFWNKAQNNNLSEEDCNVLRQTYSMWSTFYDDLNDKNPELANEDEVPLYNVNPHNSSYYYWSQEQRTGRIPPQGLALLHVDTHTDLGHVHAHSTGSGVDALGFRHFPQVLGFADRQDRAGLVNYITQSIQESPYSQEHKDSLLNFARTRPFEEIVNVINQSTRQNVHDIAQPLVAAAVSGITRSTTMVLPPWNPRLKESTRFDSNGRVIPLNISINETIFDDREIERVLDPRINSAEVDPENSLGILDQYRDRNYESPIGTYDPKLDSDWTRPSGITFDLAVSPLSRETRTNIPGETNLDSQATSELRDFSAYLPASAQSDGFILDIDLDAFVSNGDTSNPIAEPVSFGRTQSLDRGGDRHESSHGSFNELDPNTEVLSTEMNAIKARMDSFFERLQEAKEKGVLPKVITIADSTTLFRAMEGQEDDSLGGGNFTPSCMAFLLNYMVRQRLEAIYNVDAVSSEN